uniref:Uncharacterized protein n=1 Tax=Trichogramma kaykai TaxID=54128 RepID=A0ABD2W0E4_9HYME
MAGGFGPRVAANALLTLEHSKKGGYVVEQDEAKMVMKLFEKHGLFEKSTTDLKKCLAEDQDLANLTKGLKLLPDLSLHDLILMGADQAAKRLSLKDYHEFVWANQLLGQVPEKCYRACGDHVSEKMARRFYRRWALDPFWDLIHYVMSRDCCELVLAQPLFSNQDLWNICVAAARENAPPKKSENSRKKSSAKRREL